MNPATTTAPPASGPRGILLLLMAINAMNFFDRQILPAVQESIRKEWQLSDGDLGWLNTAFIILYALVGIPFGRLADAWGRKWILAGGLFLWSALTALSGFAWSFWSLFFLRLGVGIGEASCAPVAGSLIGDLFPPARRARAMAVFMLGLPIGISLSYMLSSAIAQHGSWSHAFFIAGVPGLLLCLAALRLKEPARGAAAQEDSGSLPLAAGIRRVLGSRTLWLIILSGAVHNFNMYALGGFLPSLLRRYHGLSGAEAGTITGLVFGSFGAIGMFIAGSLGDRAYRKSAGGRLQLAWITAALTAPCLFLALLAESRSPWIFTLWLLPASFCMYGYYGCVYATIQDLVGPRLRGLAMAVYFFAMYLLGGLLGPVVLGRLSDRCALQAAGRAGAIPAPDETGRILLPESFRGEGLHQAFYIVPWMCILLALLLLAASRTVAGDLRAASTRQAP